MDAHSHRVKMPYSFRAVNATYVNAYAFPGGSIAGSIRAAAPDDYGNFVLAWSVKMDPENFPDKHDVMIRCFDPNGSGFPCGVDVDGDGVLDMYDCDRLNPYLRYDLDSDGRCDLQWNKRAGAEFSSGYIGHGLERSFGHAFRRRADPRCVPVRRGGG